MLNTYNAQPLTAGIADMIFPLVQMTEANITLQKWQDFVAEYVCTDDPVPESQWLRDKGIVVIRNDRGYVHGVFSYEIRTDMSIGTVLHVDNVKAVEIVAREHVLNCMREAMDRLLRLHGCAATYVAVDEPNMRMKSFFSDAGFVPRKIRYCAPAPKP
ncbi:hypothetical protein [Thalassospira profundimaris]|nr:hypothetical protein [Thalassospira profundimaris]